MTENLGDNLSIYYHHQLYQNHERSSRPTEGLASVYPPLEHTPLLKGSITGYVWSNGGWPIQFFVEKTDGSGFEFREVGNPEIKVVEGKCDHETGVITFVWNAAPGHTRIKIDYEGELAK